MAPVRDRVDQVTQSPVFVDASGRRRRWVTWALAAAAAACTGYLVLLAFSFAGGPLTPHDLLPWPGDDRSSRPERFEPGEDGDPAVTPSSGAGATTAPDGPAPSATGTASASGGASATPPATAAATASAGAPTTATAVPSASASVSASPTAPPTASVSEEAGDPVPSVTVPAPGDVLPPLPASPGG
jgi:hypothetical protein